MKIQKMVLSFALVVSGSFVSAMDHGFDIPVSNSMSSFYYGRATVKAEGPNHKPFAQQSKFVNKASIPLFVGADDSSSDNSSVMGSPTDVAMITISPDLSQSKSVTLNNRQLGLKSFSYPANSYAVSQITVAQMKMKSLLDQHSEVDCRSSIEEID